jgi:hypothetical protein
MNHHKSFAPAILFGLSALLAACGRGHWPQAQLTSGAAPEVEYGGCWAVSFPGLVCTLRPELTLKLWVKADPGTKIEIDVGGRRRDAVGKEIGDGRRFLLTLPAGASLLTVRLRRPDGTRSPSWSLALSGPDVPAWYAAAKKNPKRTPELLSEARKLAPRKEQGLIWGMLAILARGQGNKEDEEGDLKAAIQVDHQEGTLSGEAGEIEEKVQLARIYSKEGRIAEARQVLRASLPAGAPVDAEYQLAYHQALLADRVGEYRSALEQLARATLLAERVGMLSYLWDAEQILARILQGLGRTQESEDLFARLQRDPHPQIPCDLGSLWTNQAWSLLLAREGGEVAKDPTPLLQTAADIFDHDRCFPEQRLNARLNLALAHQQAKRWPEAGKDLMDAEPLLPHANSTDRLWWLDLEGRTAIHENRPGDALGYYDELAKWAENAQSLEGRFRAALGRANVDLERKRRRDAIEDLAIADHLIDEQIWQIPAREGRETFVAQQEKATRLYLWLLLEAKQPKRAFDLARRARSRLLRQLTVRDRLAQLNPAEQRDWDAALSKYWALRHAIDQATPEWKLSDDQVAPARKKLAAQLAEAQKGLDNAMAVLGDPGEIPLSPPGRGEVLLIYHPLPQGWIGFAAYPGGLQVARFDLPDLGDPEALARVLLVPFRRLLEGSERVRVLPYGPLQKVDFHSLPLSGEPLLARHLVVYSLDLPGPSTSSTTGRHKALLVADPEGNLPAARDEAQAVAMAIPAWGSGWTLKSLTHGQASAKSVLDELVGADLFHFAGHGNFTGFAGWDSELRLANGSRLTLGDLLALHRVPAWVVLSACDAGRASEQTPGEGIGLAQAFLLAGSQVVIAASRSVEDRDARDLLREMYQNWQPGAGLPQQFLRAQRACLRHDPTSGCNYFRLLER